MDDERYTALLQVYQTLPRLDFTTTDVIGLEEDQYAQLLVELGLLKPEPFTEDASEEEEEEVKEDLQHILVQLRSASFWSVVEKAMNTLVLQRFFMEQLVIKNYVQHRIFLCPWEEKEEWFPCDVHSGSHTIYAPFIFQHTQLMHQGEDAPILLVFDAVESPMDPLPFQEVYAYLDHVFVMKEKGKARIEEMDHFSLVMNKKEDGSWEVTAGLHLHLLDDVDPSYFEELLEVGERSGFANRYLSPLLVHDILLHAAPVKMKGKDEDVIEYVNALLPTASVPYQQWYAQTTSFMEAPFFLHSLFKFLALTS